MTRIQYRPTCGVCWCVHDGCMCYSVFDGNPSPATWRGIIMRDGPRHWSASTNHDLCERETIGTFKTRASAGEALLRFDAALTRVETP